MMAIMNALRLVNIQPGVEIIPEHVKLGELNRYIVHGAILLSAANPN